MRALVLRCTAYRKKYYKVGTVLYLSVQAWLIKLADIHVFLYEIKIVVVTPPHLLSPELYQNASIYPGKIHQSHLQY